MALIDQVKAICDRLAPHGWQQLIKFVTHDKLDIQAATPAALATALGAVLSPTDVNRGVSGLEDFAQGPTAGIVAGSPARSLLFHMFASPGVIKDAGGANLTEFPTLAELDVIENYIFSARKATLASLFTANGSQKFSVVVFASEYRPAKDTCARRQADMAFSRIGISRVGTAPARYQSDRRGFWLEDSANPFAIRVCPCRYVAYLAIKKTGNASAQIPMNHKAGDGSLDFWIPVHKLFDGPECLGGVDLAVKFSARHVNEKIRRIHTMALNKTSVPTTAPFRFTEGIAELSTNADSGPGVLEPVVHIRLVEPAVDAANKPVTFKVPANNQSNFGAFEPGNDADAFGEIRPCPAYIHARTQIKDGSPIDLNNDSTRPNVHKTVADGNFAAQHYVDFTGDGEIKVECAALVGKPQIAGTPLAAYSLVSAPDFFPSAGQREITEWSRRVPASLQTLLWAIPTTSLNSVRLPANLQLPGGSFDRKDTTMSAVVPLIDSPAIATSEPKSPDAVRHSYLPDDGAGVFAPGWDVSHDVLKQGSTETPHLAAYGLGSPFPEDAKLCAALSTFWPAVAPDAARTMLGNPASRTGTVAAHTDEEIGQIGGLPWDGIAGPKLITQSGGQVVLDGTDFFHADYVQTALDNRFSVRIAARLTIDEYQRRVLSMALVHDALDRLRNNWFVISYVAVTAGNPELQEAQTQTSTILSGPVYRVDLCRNLPATVSPTDFQRRQMPVMGRTLFFVSPNQLTTLRKPVGASLWTKKVVT